MKSILIFLILILLSNCSLNKDSKFWTEDVIKKKENKKKLLKIIKKSEDITTMTLSEYKIYIEDYIKKSKYPDINQ